MFRYFSRMQHHNSSDHPLMGVCNWIRCFTFGAGFFVLFLLAVAATDSSFAGSQLADYQQTIPPTSSIVSDDFNRCTLNAKNWEFIDPLGDSEIAMLGEQVEITVPSGVSHDAWFGGNMAPRLMQPADDTNFEIEAKFDSSFAKHIQLQGVIIEQDADNYLRINTQSNGTQTELLMVHVTDGVPDIYLRETIEGAAPIFLRLLRWKSLDLWRVSYSFDGIDWISGAKFELTHPLSVAKVGVFAGNAGPNPAFKAHVDYFFNRAFPIAPEDAVANQLHVAVDGDGVVHKEPECGTPVSLTASPSPGWNFEGWSGALSGSNAVETVQIQANDLVTATFVPKDFTIDVSIVGDGQILRSLDQPFYDNGDVLMLTAAASPGWAFDRWQGDLTGQDPIASVTVSQNLSVAAIFRPTTVGDAGIRSDDFNRCTIDESIWTFEDPLKDATLGTNGEQLIISVPAGISHDIWKEGIQAPYLWQPAADTDMGIELSYESTVNQRYQLQGMLILQDEQNLLRINVQHDNTSPRLIVVRIIDGTPKILADELVAGSGPFYLRVIRTQNIWSINYGFDGINWLSSSDLLFTHSMAVTKVGAFVGNAAIPDESPPAFEGHLDYFFNIISPVEPEDETANYLPIQTVGQGEVTKEPVCGNPTTVTAIPEDGWVFRGWQDGLSSENATEQIHFERGDSLTAVFEPVVENSVMQSDVFNQCLLNGSVWRVVDPQGDATIGIFDSQQLEIRVPGGNQHDVWLSGIQAPHVVQEVNNVDFEIDVKFGTRVEEAIQLQGILVLSNPQNFLRFSVQSMSNGPQFLIIAFEDGIAKILHQDSISTDDLYFRLQRSGSSWVVRGSKDGVAWEEIATVEHELLVSQIGLFAGNATNNPPPFTAKFDYIINRSLPLADESSSELQLNLAVSGSGIIEATPNRNQFTCGELVSLTAKPASGWSFVSWSGDAEGTLNPLEIEINSGRSITANFSQNVFTLDTNIIGGGSILVEPLREAYLYGESIEVIAVEQGEWNFAGWSGDLVGTDLSSSLEITSNRQITATFVKDSYFLSVESVGEGRAEASKTEALTFDEEVTLTAIPNEGWRFLAWSQSAPLHAGGARVSDQAVLTVRIRSDETYFANFVRITTDALDPDQDPGSDPDGADPNGGGAPFNTGRIFLPLFLN